ncbi:hypothetical protein BDV96DRAFT_654117 [Lophiotrema nucula]|uniref:Uncharacterized protein n=1 Tax=Lophiotrema nucula TaxID=690887 RepID=A0A6A5YJ00_9PLEO|nr:hypothetical protein BDV96DRAFT_654117 [Lophiotrema nucula]
MLFLFLLSLLLGVICLAKEGDVHCHGSNSPHGKVCNFKDTGFIDGARLYCSQYYMARLVPVGTPRGVPYNYAKIRAGDAYRCPGFGRCDLKPAIFLGYIRFDLAYGNWADPSDEPANWNWLSYERCMEYMGEIQQYCGGQGGAYETGYGSVFGICIQA